MNIDPYLGEIRLLSLNFIPAGWLACEGQLLPIRQYESLFSLLGATYGGDGQVNFALPDLRGRVAVGTGHAPGMATYELGHKGGREWVLPTVEQLPAHSHPFIAMLNTSRVALEAQPEGGLPAAGPVKQFAQGTPNAALAPDALTGLTSVSGYGRPHENRQPLIALTYAIAIEGEYPRAASE